MNIIFIQRTAFLGWLDLWTYISPRILAFVLLLTLPYPIAAKDVSLESGLNFFSYPVEPPFGLTCLELQSLLNADSVRHLDAQTQLFELCESPSFSFPILPGEGYVILMPTPLLTNLVGDTSCPFIDLATGVNSIGIPTPATGLRCFDLLTAIGDEQTVSSIQNFNTVSGKYESCAYNLISEPGVVVGNNFAIVSGAAYWVSMLTSLNGIQLNDLSQCQLPPPSPVIVSFSPTSGSAGTLISLNGANLAPSVELIPRVTMLAQGGGSIVVPVARFDNNSIELIVPSGADSGPLIVTVGEQIAVSTQSFSIESSSSFTLVAEPANADIIQGHSVTYSLRVNSSNNFTHLAELNISGLPEGITASFKPSLLTAGQQSTLTLTATDSQTLGSSDFSINVSAEVEGIQLNESANLTVTVQPVSTSFMGRTVIADALQTPLSGITVSFLGLDGEGNLTGCTGQTTSDAAGNFSFTNLPLECTGNQLIRYDGLTVDPQIGQYAGVDLIYNLSTGVVTESPVLVHLPRIDNAETVQVIQNALEDQVFTFATVPNLEVTVYAGTTLTLVNGDQPDPFPLTAVQVPIDRLPEETLSVEGLIEPFIVAFQPANAMASQQVAVTFPNLSDELPGADLELGTLDPTRGIMVVYGTGTVSDNGLQIIPDIDPANPGMRFGLVNFDWHGPRGRNGGNPCKLFECEMAGAGPGGDGDDDGFNGFGGSPGPGGGPQGGEAPGGRNPPAGGSPGGDSPLGGGFPGAGFGSGSDDGFMGSMGNNANSGGFGSSGNSGSGSGFSGGGGVDLFSGQFAFSQTDLAIRGRTAISINRVYRSMFGNMGAFGVGTEIHFQYCVARLTTEALNLIDPEGRRIRFNKISNDTFRNDDTNALAGAILTELTDGTFVLRFKYGGIYRFGVTGCLVQIEGRNNEQIIISRNSTGDIEQITDADGRNINLAYTTLQGSRVISSATDDTGRTVIYRYNIVRNQPVLTEVVNPEGGVTQYGMTDVFGGGAVVLTSITNPNGDTVLSNSYDNQGRVTRQDLADNSAYSYDYTINGGMVSQATVTDPMGATFSCRFNSEGVAVQRTDKRGQSQILARESGSNRISRYTDSLGRSTSMEYDADGNVTQITERDGSTTNYTYDSTFNRILSIEDDQNNIVTFEYDANGNLISMESPNPANTLFITRNTFGQPISFLDSSGRETVMTYDNQGNLTDIVDASGNRTSYTHDTLSRITSITDPRGNKTFLSYDVMDRIIQTTNSDGRNIKFGYDKNSRLETVTDENNNTITYQYNSRGNLVATLDALGRGSIYRYDSVGRVTQRTDRQGRVINYVRDRKGRLTQAQYPDGESVVYTYDAIGRMIQAEDSVTGIQTFEYDNADQLVRETSANGTLEYQYDSLGRRTSLAIVGQEPIHYTYDNQARLTRINRALDYVEISYGSTGLVTTIGRSNGVVTTYTHNQLRQITAIDHTLAGTALASVSYNYDKAGNRTGMSTNHGLSLGTTARNNTIGLGNRLLMWGASSLRYDEAGQLVEIIDPDGTTALTWDARGRLTQFEAPLISAQFTYDPFGRRLSKTINGVRTDYLYDFKNLLQESQEGVPTASYLSALGIDTTFARTEDNGTTFLLKDGLGSVVASTDASGNVLTRYAYDPFGQTTVIGNSKNQLQFTGRERDETGLYYYRARYYSTEFKRFISEDPVGFFGGDANLYTYVANDPILFSDPTGQFPLEGIFRLTFERPVTPDEIKQYQSPEGRERRRRATAGVQATVMGLDLAQSAIPGGGGKSPKGFLGAGDKFAAAAGAKGSQLGALGVSGIAGASGGDRAGSLSSTDF